MTLYPPGAERWRVVVGAVDYLVSDRGSVTRATPGQGTRAGPLRPSPHVDGGLQVNLRALRTPRGTLRVTRARFIHHLVLEAFVGPCPVGMVAEHLDHDLTNNALTNLRWSTRPPARGGGTRKLTADIVRAIRASPATDTEMAVAYGVTVSNVGKIRRRETWARVP